VPIEEEEEEEEERKKRRTRSTKRQMRMDESRGSDYNRSTHRIEDRGSMRDNSKWDFF
jgi:hypothetical protein